MNIIQVEANIFEAIGGILLFILMSPLGIIVLIAISILVIMVTLIYILCIIASIAFFIISLVNENSNINIRVKNIIRGLTAVVSVISYLVFFVFSIFNFNEIIIFLLIIQFIIYFIFKKNLNKVYKNAFLLLEPHILIFLLPVINSHFGSLLL